MPLVPQSVFPLNYPMLTDDISVTSMHLRPYFLQYQHPKLILVGLTKQRLSYFIHRHEVIHQNLLYFAIDLDGHFVQACWIVGLLPKNVNYSTRLFGNGCQCR